MVLVTACVVASFVLTNPSHCVRSTQLPSSIKEEILDLDVLERPREVYVRVDTPLLPLAEKDIIVRSAFVSFYGEGNPKFKNCTIILIEVKKSLLEENAIQSCGVEGSVTTQFEISNLNSEECSAKETHTQALLYCYDIPVKHLDWAWVSYRKKLLGRESTHQAKSEFPVLFSDSPSSRGKIVVCAAMLPYYTPYVDKWLEYQRTIGVDHVHMILESTFLNQGSFEASLLQEAVEEGYLSIDFWHQWLNQTDICDHSLDLAYHTCALQFRSSYSYIMFSDPRDFFIPQGGSLSDVVSHSCSNTHCRFQQRDLFYESCNNVKVGKDGNLTAAVSATKLEWKGNNAFTVYKSSKVAFAPYKTVPFTSTHSVANIPAKKGYVIHLVKSETSSDYKRILPKTESCM